MIRRDRFCSTAVGGVRRVRLMIIKPRVRGFVCLTAHPTGCAAHVQEQIDYVKARGAIENGPGNVLVIGASTGYGLASRITASFGSGARTMGVFFERPPEEEKCATAGWYNSAAFHRAAGAEGLYARSFNGDAFSDEMKAQVVEAVKADLGQIDLVVYSLAAPRREHPRTGKIHKSTLKPIGQDYTSRTLDTDEGMVSEVTIESATGQEIADTVAVMGGEDWSFWMEALDEGGVLAPGTTAVAYDYIGPEATWAVYTNGTMGRAKIDLRNAARQIDVLLKANGGGGAYVSVNKALVTQASSAIPVVPLYISILYRVMKEKGNHEGTIEQIQRLFSTHLYNNNEPQLDDKGLIRIDDWEMEPDIQDRVKEIWPLVTSGNLREITDFNNYQEEFLKLFGFGLPGVDYDQEVDPMVGLDD